PLFSIARGRFISAFDQEHARPVVVLGAAISESLFPNTDALGKTVRINGSVYEVVGVFEHDQGLFVGPGVDIFAVIPLSCFKKEYPEAKELIMAFTVPENVNVETAQGEVIQAMRRLRRIPAGKENDFELSSPDFISNLWNQLTGALVILTTVISSIGLLVGGIGVMNIMLISVTERTQEIGVRKAIGARRADVRLQFLLEAVVLTLVGGTIGILIGAGVSATARKLRKQRRQRAALSGYFLPIWCFSFRGGFCPFTSHRKCQRGNRPRILRKLVQPPGQDAGRAASLGYTARHDYAAPRRGISLRHAVADQQRRHHD